MLDPSTGIRIGQEVDELHKQLAEKSERIKELEEVYTRVADDLEEYGILSPLRDPKACADKLLEGAKHKIPPRRH